MVKITIGIVLYKNEEREIRSCLTSIFEQERELIAEVILRDQGGGDCRAHVDSWIADHPSAFPINYTEGKNVGFGAGHNLLFASRHQSSTAYLCLNPDGAMHPDCLSTIVKIAEKSRWHGIYEAIQEPIMHPKKFDPQSGITAWCSGACLLISTSIFEEIHGFDDDFFLYCEDVDLSWRVKAAGYQCFTCQDAMFFHYAMDRTAREVEMWKSACILAHKWRSASFKTHALNVLATLSDVDRNDIQADIESFPQRTLENVYRAKPHLRNGLTFAEPMWAA